MRTIPRTALAFGVMGIMLITLRSAASPRALDRGEMASARGGSLMLGKCQESCNRFNGYHDDCYDGDPNNCETCSKAAAVTEYLDHAGGCDGEGFQLGDDSIDCGRKQRGICTSAGECQVYSTSTNSCNDRDTIVAQP